MKLLQAIRWWLHDVFRWRRVEQDMQEELRAHILMRTQDNVREGMLPETGALSARKRFGNISYIEELSRDVFRGQLLGSVSQDLRVAARSLARKPRFSLGIALTLGLGIGVATAVYTAVDAVVLRELPYRDPSTLVAVGWINSGADWVAGATNVQNLTPMWDPTFVQLRERARSFDDLAGLVLKESNLGPDRVRIAGGTPGLLEMLDAKPALGRMFLPDEYDAKPRVAMIAHGTWERRFGADPDVLGRSLPGTEGQLTVVGVLASDFLPPEAFIPMDEFPELWIPIRVDRFADEVRRVEELQVLGRLGRGRSLKDARTEVGRIAADLAVQFPSRNVQRGVARRLGVNELQAQTIGSTGKLLQLFLGAALLLLILAGMNGATLLLARSLDRTREFGIRLALGAGRVRLVRLLVTEAVLLALAGGAAGVLFAYAGVALLVNYLPPSISLLKSLAVDTHVLLVATAVSLGMGIGTGLLPALSLAKRESWSHLQGAGRTLVGSSSPLRSVLVGGQVAAALVLLCATGLLFNSFVRLQTSDIGFEDRELIEAGVETKGGSAWNFQSHWRSWDVLLAELRTVPGVASVALTSNVPFQSLKWTPLVLLPGDLPNRVRPNISGYVITPGYLDLVGTRMLAGRDFTSQDQPGSERVALVNETFARTIVGSMNAIDRTILWSAGTEWAEGNEWIPPPEWRAGQPAPLRIVGIVEDVVQLRLGEGPRPAIYVPHTQSRPLSPRAVVRSSLPLEAVAPGIRAAVARFNPRIPGPLEIVPMALKQRAVLRFQVLMIGAFAITAMLLAAGGLYGAMLHFVGLRRREFGVRMALGASRAGVLALVLRQGALVSIPGLGCGIVITLLFGQVLAGFLFGVAPNDAATLFTASALLAVVAAAACLIPAYRATAVEPGIVMKDE